MSMTQSENMPKVVKIQGTDDIQDYDKEYAEYLAYRELVRNLRKSAKCMLDSLATFSTSVYHTHPLPPKVE